VQEAAVAGPAAAYVQRLPPLRMPPPGKTQRSPSVRPGTPWPEYRQSERSAETAAQHRGWRGTMDFRRRLIALRYLSGVRQTASAWDGPGVAQGSGGTPSWQLQSRQGNCGAQLPRPRGVEEAEWRGPKRAPGARGRRAEPAEAHGLPAPGLAGRGEWHGSPPVWRRWSPDIFLAVAQGTRVRGRGSRAAGFKGLQLERFAGRAPAGDDGGS